MKKTLLLAILMILSFSAFAQTSTAVLVHNDSVQVFYGLNALVDAHSAAVNGDIITLSSGSFTGLTITKAITIRGAGIQFGTASAQQATIIASDVTINRCNDSIHHLTMEGIQHNGQIKYDGAFAPQFIKCRFNSFAYLYQYRYGTISDAVFVNCIIGNFAVYNNSAVNSTFYNCFIGSLSNHQATIYNCICGFSYSAGYDTPSLSAYNSILFANGGSVVDGYVFSNCVGIQTGTDGWGNSHPYFGYSYVSNWTNSNTSLTSYDSVFNTFRGQGDSWSDNNSWYANDDFHLTDSAAATYLGSDSTQVGIYGGTFPFDPVPSYITVKRCNVASRSTADGKLSVDIELISE